MTAVATVSADPLSPVREALLARARASADDVVRDADAESTAILAQAQQEADALLADARAQGRADAEALLAGERARARRQARGAVLAAQRAAFQDLRDAVTSAVLGLRDDPGYEPWRDRLLEQAGAVLGEDAEVSEHPDGGVLAEAGSRRAAFTLGGLAERVLEALGPDLESLWSS